MQKPLKLKLSLWLKLNNLLLFIAFFLPTGAVEAYPRMVRHGYSQCMACHVSPTGGGVLTAYGRSMSKEVLSTWSSEGEEKFLYGAFSGPEWLHLSGDIRSIQTHYEDASVRKGYFFPMQMDIDAAAVFEKWTIAGTYGLGGGPESKTDRFKPLSRRHYVQFRPNSSYSIRAGRFYPQFGIKDPNHTIATRRGLGFDQAQESYNLEAAYIGESFDVFLTGIFGRPDINEQVNEKGGALTGSVFLAEKMKIGLSSMILDSPSTSRTVVGVFGILGLTENLYSLSEVDLQYEITKATQTEAKGPVSYNQLGYVIMKGLIGYGMHQLSYLNLNSVSSRADSFGLGMHFYPRPHLDLQLEFRKERNESVGSHYADVAFLTFHYYL